MIATKVNTKNLGFMATQYEKYGCITATEVINAFIDEQLEIGIEMLRDYNEYLSEHGYELYFSMESLDEMLSGYSPLEIIKKTHYGNFRYSDEYCQFGGDANIDSFSEYQIVSEMSEDRDFLYWYIERNELISEEDIQAAIQWGGKYLLMGY